MILLSEDGKTLVEIKSWEDVVDRPGYTEKVNPDEVTLKQIIGRYHISPKQPCGISSCGTAHNMGFLVVCEGGIETNIGNKCGKRIFGVDFQNLEKTFTRATNAQRYRENIAKVKNQLEPFERKLTFLRDGENQGAWCISKVEWYATKGFEQKTLDALHERAKRGDSVISKTVALSAAEREAAGGSIHREETVAIIGGLSCIKSYKKLKTLLYSTLGDELVVFKSLEEDTLDFPQLKRWNNWANTIEKKITQAEKIIDDCHRFLVDSNIQTIRTCKHLL